jgi:hypothetical protein
VSGVVKKRKKIMEKDEKWKRPKTEEASEDRRRRNTPNDDVRRGVVVSDRCK